MILREGHPALGRVCAPFVFAADDSACLAAQLVSEMSDARGLGLAAPQIGVERRAFALKTAARPIVCFNPTIVHRADGEDRGLEGCLSYPGIFVWVRRARRILARFQDAEGAWREREFCGLEARTYQHELDHLEGRTLPDFVPAPAFAAAKAKADVQTAS